MSIYKGDYYNTQNEIELRLYDDKISEINLNDVIIFHKIYNLVKIIEVKVTGSLKYNYFSDLFQDVDYNICGTASSLSEKLYSIRKIYSEEKERKNGILDIHIEKNIKEGSYFRTPSF